MLKKGNINSNNELMKKLPIQKLYTGTFSQN